jgi:hypothetical protein
MNRADERLGMAFNPRLQEEITAMPSDPFEPFAIIIETLLEELPTSSRARALTRAVDRIDEYAATLTASDSQEAQALLPPIAEDEDLIAFLKKCDY